MTVCFRLEPMLEICRMRWSSTDRTSLPTTVDARRLLSLRLKMKTFTLHRIRSPALVPCCASWKNTALGFIWRQVTYLKTDLLTQKLSYFDIQALLIGVLIAMPYYLLVLLSSYSNFDSMILWNIIKLLLLVGCYVFRVMTNHKCKNNVTEFLERGI